MPLLNVRLDERDAQMAGELRRAGVRVSAVVREAIRTEYERRFPSPRGLGGAARIVAEIFARFPDPPELAPRIDARDREAVKRHIASKLARKRS